MSVLVEKYGKQFMKELMDMVLINNAISQEKMREMLIEKGTITRRTKTIRVSYNIAKHHIWEGGRRVDTGKNTHTLSVKNGRNMVLAYMKFHSNDIPQILEAINSETC